MHLIRQRGFTLLEVMVSLFIIAIGLLGIAKIQALAYSSSGSSNIRALVAMEAAGLAANMHANRSYWTTLATPYTMTITGLALSDSTMNAATATCKSGDGAPCLPAALAAADLHTWAKTLSNPGTGIMLNLNPVTTINCPTPTNANIPLTCTIVVTWNEKAVAINSQSTQTVAAAETTFLPTYTLFVQP